MNLTDYASRDKYRGNSLALLMIRVILLFIFLWSAPAFSQEQIDVAQAINYALAQNRELVRSALSIDSGSLGVTSARAEFQVSIRPEVSMDFSGSQGRTGYGLRASKKFEPGSVVSVGSKVLQTQGGSVNPYRDSLQIEIQQPLFRNFGSLIHGEATVQANNALKTAQRRLEMQKADMVVDVVQTYENILRLKTQVRAAEESFKRMDALYRVTKAKELLGRTTRVDTLRVELLRGQASSLLENSRERFNSTQRDFAELLGFSPDSVFDLKPTPLLKFDIPEPEKTVRIALENRLDYAQVIQESGDAVRGVRIAEKKLLPDLKLFARHEWFGEAQNVPDAMYFNQNIWFIGISVDTDFNLTRERASIGQAQVNQTSASQRIEITELSIARQVQQHILIYQRAGEELKIAEKNFKLAESRSRLARRLFEIGKGDNFSVTDAEESYLQAEGKLFSARAEATISGYRLFRVVGTLIESPEGLKPRRVN